MARQYFTRSHAFVCGILINGLTRIPTIATLTGQIGTFSNWRATQFHPRAHRLDGVMHLPNNARNILAPPVSQALSVAIFSIGGLVFPSHRLFWISYVI